MWQDLARIRTPLPQPAQPPWDPQILRLEMALPPRDGLLEIRGDGDVGWSALLHEYHEGLPRRDSTTIGVVVSPWGVFRSSELHSPAVFSVRRPLGLRQAALSEVEAPEWLVLGWRLRLTQGGHLVNLSRALFLLLPICPAAFLS